MYHDFVQYRYSHYSLNQGLTTIRLPELLFSRSNRHWLFRGLEDPSEESGEDFLKPPTYPSVRKLNLKVFSVKPEPVQADSVTTRAVEGTNEADSPSPLTIPVTSLQGDVTPVRSSVPPSHDNSPTPDIIKVSRSFCRPSVSRRAWWQDNVIKVIEILASVLNQTASLFHRVGAKSRNFTCRRRVARWMTP